MIRGSCGCGAVRFELSAAPTMMGTCHCSRCRKIGAATFVFVARDDFVLTAGREAIATWPAAPPFRYDRNFCGRCGTALGEPLSTMDRFPLNAHTLDDDPGVRNRFHEFVADKPGWYEICDDARQFPGHPPSG